MKQWEIAYEMYKWQEYCKQHTSCEYCLDDVFDMCDKFLDDINNPPSEWGINKADINRLKREEKITKTNIKQERGYRFWVCKEGNKTLNEFIPVTNSFHTLDEANTWMLKYGCSTKETLYVIKAHKDMWGEEEIEPLELEREGK